MHVLVGYGLISRLVHQLENSLNISILINHRAHHTITNPIRIDVVIHLRCEAFVPLTLVGIDYLLGLDRETSEADVVWITDDVLLV